MTRILHAQLSYDLTGICFGIQNKIGRFCREKQYADALEFELKQKQIPHKREFEFPGAPVRGNRFDFLIDEKIILDVKAKKFVTKEDYFQMQRYLQGANLELGLIANFRNTYFKFKRVLNSEGYSGHSDV